MDLTDEQLLEQCEQVERSLSRVSFRHLMPRSPSATTIIITKKTPSSIIDDDDDEDEVDEVLAPDTCPDEKEPSLAERDYIIPLSVQQQCDDQDDVILTPTHDAEEEEEAEDDDNDEVEDFACRQRMLCQERIKQEEREFALELKRHDAKMQQTYVRSCVGRTKRRVDERVATPFERSGASEKSKKHKAMLVQLDHVSQEIDRMMLSLVALSTCVKSIKADLVS